MQSSVVAFLALSIMLCSEAAAQTASVSGSVQDASGAVLPGVTVSIKSLETGATRTATTGDQGNFLIASLPAGKYEFKAELRRFKTAVYPSVELIVGQIAVVNFTLDLGAVAELITVSAEPPLVETGTGATSAVVVQKQIRDLPLNGRSYVDLALLSAGVSKYTQNNKTSGVQSKGPLLSINGARPKANAFYLDGALLNDGLNQTPGSVSGNLLGVDAVREFRLLTNAYSAQYGAAGGGALVAITRSGSNQYHGSVFEFLRNDHLDTRNFFDGPSKPAFKRNQFGFSLGGPIKKDKSFLFGQYEGLREALGTTGVAKLPSENAHQGRILICSTGQFRNVGVNGLIKPFLDAMPFVKGTPDQCPSRPGPDDVGLAKFPFSFQQITREDYFTLRPDFKFGERDTFFGRYTFDDADLSSPRPAPGFHNAVTSRNQYLTLEWDQVRAANFVHIVRLSFVRTNMLSNPVSDASIPSGAEVVAGAGYPQLAIAGLTTFGPDRALPKRPTQNSFQLSYDTTYARGAHEIRAGFFFDDIQNNFLNTNSESGDIITNPSGPAGGRVSGLQNFLQNKSLVIRFGGDPRSRRQFAFRHTLLHSYVEDTLKLSRNLTVVLGLRYEPSTNIEDKFGNVLQFRNPLSDPGPTIGAGPFLNPTKKNVAARVGFSWSPFQKTVIRGGYGRFNELLGVYLFNRYLLSSPVFLLFNVSNSSLPFKPTTGAPTFVFFQFDLKNPYIQQWNLSVQREITNNAAITLAYTGSKGTHLINQQIANPNRPQIQPDGSLKFAPPFKRLNPNIVPPVAVNLITSDANSWYHALQVVGTKRFSSHFTFNVSYVFSRFIDEKSSQGGNDDTGGYDGFSQMNPFDRHNNKGLSAYQQKHSLVLNYIYELPRGENLGWAGRTLLGGWQVQGITTIRSGLPFSPFLAGDRANVGTLPEETPTQRPNLNPGFRPSKITGGPPTQFFNPAAFSLPDPGRFGNLGRNVLIGPSFASVDFGVIKDFKVKILGEGGTIQFRTEVFNLFNRANFSLPQPLVFTGGQAGEITSTASSSRQIQLGLRITFGSSP